MFRALPPRKRRSTPLDWGRLFTLGLAAIFALVGLIPVVLGAVLQSSTVHDWGMREVTKVLQQELGLEATFGVQLRLIPLSIELHDLRVPSTDEPGKAAIQVSSLRVTPRLFSLLGGRLDAGDIEVGPSQVTLRVKEGEIRNFKLRLPPSDGKRKFKLERSPFRSLAWTSAEVDLAVDERRIVTEEFDLDVYAAPGLEFDVALKLGGARISDEIESQRAASDTAPRARTHVEDRLCGLDLRAKVSLTAVQVQRLSLLGAADLGAAHGTPLVCGGSGVEQIAVRLTQAAVQLGEKGVDEVRGGIFARLPVQLAERYVRFPKSSGLAGFSGKVHWRPGMRLPFVDGQVRAEGVSLGKFRVAELLTADVHIENERIEVPHLEADWANGHSVLTGLEVHPFAGKGSFSMKRVEARHIDFPGIMRDLGVAPHTIVDWHHDLAHVDGVHGTLKPFSLDGAFHAETSKFVVWNKGFDHPDRKRMIGVDKATIGGRVRATAAVFEVYSTLAEFGHSRMPVDLVSIGLGGPKDRIAIRIQPGATLELGDVGPIANLPVAGRAELDVSMAGPMNHPKLEGKLTVAGLKLGRFELGDLGAGAVQFEPLYVTFRDLVGRKNALEYAASEAELRFDGKAPLELTMAVTSERLDVPELIRTLHFDENPRFRELKGNGRARANVRYVLGGPDDVCDGGRLIIASELGLKDLLFEGERFSPANGAFRLDWFDIPAGTRGMDLKIDGVRLGKGSGAIYGEAHVYPEAKMKGEFMATRIPVGRVDALGAVGGLVEGSVTGRASLDGSLDALHVLAHTSVSELGVPGASFPASVLDVELVPRELPLRTTGEVSGCKRPIAAEFSQSEYDKDESDGDVVVKGSLFGGQIRTDGLKISRQRSRVLSGNVTFQDFNFGGLAALGSPEGEAPLAGVLSGTANIDELRVETPFKSTASVQVDRLMLTRAGYSARTSTEGARLSLGREGLRLHSTALVFRAPGQEEARLLAGGLLGQDLSLVATVRMEKTPLGTFLGPISAVESAEGSLVAGLDVAGTLKSPQLSGYLEVEGGKVQLKALKPPVLDLNVLVQVEPSGVTVQTGSARLGGGSLKLTGGAPISDGALGEFRLALLAEDVALPLGSDVRVGMDADLSLEVPRGEGRLPRLSGKVNVDSAHYERVMNMTADLVNLGARGKKTEIVDVDAENARLALDVVVMGRRPLQIKNELVTAGLLIEPEGVRITGTDKKFGAVGNVEVIHGGRIVLRQNEFEIRNGIVRFGSPVELRPEVDVTAINEFRRNQGVNAFGSSAATQAGTSGAGNYRITLHAYGQIDDIKIDLTSDPPLPQDDIFLLLTLGLTRSELDRTQNSGVGSSAALEALGTLTGAESAVSNVVKVDEFRFGTTYSSRTGRNEPTVTIGKRLGDRIRASVTTSISEANELRSNVEYQASPHLSVEGSYDNAQRSGGPAMGNIGGDVRWRLEFD